MSDPRLEVHVFQLAEDKMMKENRTDGTGWEWCWANWEREWMNRTPRRHAYRCLPLTIVNQTGWWIKNPVGFTAVWHGKNEPGSIDFKFDTSPDVWDHTISNHFGEGIITWTTPFLFRTKPQGSRLLVCGPANYFKANAHPLTALIESDWISMSFTMNYKLTMTDQPVRFEQGEPIFQAIPLANNVCADLESALVTFQRLADDPVLMQAYQEWNKGRRQFHEQKARGEVKPDEWQRDYFQGRDASGREAETTHMVKVRPPQVRSLAQGNHAGKGAANGTREANESPRSDNGIKDTPIDRPPFPSTTDSVEGKPMEPRLLEHKGTTTAPGSNDGLTVNAHPQVEAEPAGPADAKSCPVARAESPPKPQFSDEWRRWIAENLMIEQSPENVLTTLKSSGFTADEAMREINLARQSPYFKGADLLRNRLKKRHWLFSVYRKLNRLHPRSATIERRHRLSREEFLCEYYSTNRPVIITGMIDDWPALQKWTLEYFATKLGDRVVEVQLGRDAGPNYEIERQKYVTRIRFSEFIEKIRAARETNDFYLTANNNSANRAALPELWDDIVQIPEYLRGDQQGSYFWMGPAGTVTPFHHDLTNNFMAQVIGRKRLKLVPSWDMPLMRNHIHCFSQRDGRTMPANPKPGAGEPQILEFVLNPGELLFLPVGCMHYVQGIDITVTVSFTNFVFDNDFSSFYTTYCPV